MSEPKIVKVVPVWVVKVNTDLTEGRGFNRVFAVCVMGATARRASSGKNVQGCDGIVERGYALTVEIDGKKVKFIPGEPETPSKEDRAEQEKIDRLEAAAERARKAGVSEEDLKILRGK
jgi:hypothetical protein